MHGEPSVRERVTAGVLAVVIVLSATAWLTNLREKYETESQISEEAKRRSVMKKLHACGVAGEQRVVDDCYEEVLYGEGSGVGGPF